MNDGLLNMVAHRIGSANRIASLAGGKNLAMFPVETLGIFGNIGCCIEMVVGDRGIAQFLNHRDQSRTPPKAIQAQVELLIQLNIASRIAGGVHLIEDGNKWRSILSLEVCGGFLGSQHLQCHTNFVVLDKVLNGRQENRDSSMGVDLHQAIALQQSKCLANGRRTDPKALRDLNLAQPGTCRKLSRDDFVPERSRNLLRYGEFCEGVLLLPFPVCAIKFICFVLFLLTNILYIMHNIQYCNVFV